MDLFFIFPDIFISIMFWEYLLWVYSSSLIRTIYGKKYLWIFLEENFVILLLLKSTAPPPGAAPPIYSQWINDNFFNPVFLYMSNIHCVIGTDCAIKTRPHKLLLYWDKELIIIILINYISAIRTVFNIII